jgi:hypothetical protein
MRYAAEKRDLQESIAELRRDPQMAMMTCSPEAAGITAGLWYAWPSTHVASRWPAGGVFPLVREVGDTGLEPVTSSV